MKSRFLTATLFTCAVALSGCSDLTESSLDDDGSDIFDVTVKTLDEDGTQRDTFYPSETMRMELNIKNVTDAPYSITFEDEQKFEFEITDSDDKVVWTWSDGETFNSEESYIALEAGESYGARYNWNLLLEDSSMLPAGTYTLSGEILNVDEIATATFTMAE